MGEFEDSGMKNCGFPVARVAKVFGFSPKTVYRMIRRGDLQAIRYKGNIRVMRDEMLKKLEEMKYPGPSSPGCSA